MCLLLCQMLKHIATLNSHDDFELVVVIIISSAMRKLRQKEDK